MEEHATRKNPSLARALTRAFGWTFFVSAVYKFLYDTLLFVGRRIVTISDQVESP